MTRIRIMCDQSDGTTVTLALLRWIGHLEQCAQISKQTHGDEQ